MKVNNENFVFQNLVYLFIEFFMKKKIVWLKINEKVGYSDINKKKYFVNLNAKMQVT